jgi:hypothetical protein
MKLAAECEERSLTLNDLFILAMLRTIHAMDRTTPQMTLAIESRVYQRFEPSSKFYRTIRMMMNLEIVKYEISQKVKKKKAEKIREQLRLNILFGLHATRI